MSVVFRALTVLLLSCVLGAAPARADGPLNQTRDAIEVLGSLGGIIETGIPPELFENAYGVAVIPGMIEAGFIIGGQHGNGLLSLRRDGVWTLPAFVTITGGSVGLQAGVQSVDLVLVFKTRRSVEDILDGKFTLGADASVAAGPVGRSASAATDLQLQAEIYAYSRSRGLFAGIALDGNVIEIDHRANASAYGAGATPASIFAGDVAQRPELVVHFVNALEERSAAAARKRAN